jgi:hypothetical protein
MWWAHSVIRGKILPGHGEPNWLGRRAPSNLFGKMDDWTKKLKAVIRRLYPQMRTLKIPRPFNSHLVDASEQAFVAAVAFCFELKAKQINKQHSSWLRPESPAQNHDTLALRAFRRRHGMPTCRNSQARSRTKDYGSPLLTDLLLAEERCEELHLPVANRVEAGVDKRRYLHWIPTDENVAGRSNPGHGRSWTSSHQRGVVQRPDSSTPTQGIGLKVPPQPIS